MCVKRASGQRPAASGAVAGRSIVLSQISVMAAIVEANSVYSFGGGFEASDAGNTGRSCTTACASLT